MKALLIAILAGQSLVTQKALSLPIAKTMAEAALDPDLFRLPHFRIGITQQTQFSWAVNAPNTRIGRGVLAGSALPGGRCQSLEGPRWAARRRGAGCLSGHDRVLLPAWELAGTLRMASARFSP